MTRPTSKIIQIRTCIEDGLRITTAICEDGSIWERDNVGSGWYCILEPLKPEAQEPKTLIKRIRRFLLTFFINFKLKFMEHAK